MFQEKNTSFSEKPAVLKINFSDVHCHLFMLSDKEIEKEIINATKKGVTKIITNSTSFQSNQYNLRLSKTFSNVKSALGLYPLDAMEFNEEELNRAFGFIEKHVKESIAIGEVGLDYKFGKTESDKIKQALVFERFIELAKKYDKPIIVHSRYAQSQVLDLLEKKNAKKVVLHSFVDSQKLIQRAVENNYFISVGMAVIKNTEIQERVKIIPVENILLETDSPIHFYGKKAMPENIIEIAKKIAELKGISIEELSHKLEQNFSSLFGMI